MTTMFETARRTSFWIPGGRSLSLRRTSVPRTSRDVLLDGSDSTVESYVPFFNRYSKHTPVDLSLNTIECEETN